MNSDLEEINKIFAELTEGNIKWENEHPEEMKERARRAKNLILFRMPEQIGVLSEYTRQIRDREEMKKMLAGIDNIDLSGISVKRLGKYNASHGARPLLIMFRTAFEARKVKLTCAKFPACVAVEWDKTPFQRENKYTLCYQ